MALYPVGVSSYGEHHGRTQYVTSATTAAQVRSLIAESAGVFAGGAVLSVNEGVRSRDDQAAKLAAWQRYQRGGPWAPLAASPLFTSTHDESRGSALDFGVTMADGRNRAMTMSEQSWVVKRGQQRGIRWTGADFRPTPESWHFNGGYDAEVPPLAGPASSGGAVVIPGGLPPATSLPKEPDMIVFANLKTDVWAVAQKGHFDPIEKGKGDLLVAASGLPLQRVEDHIFNGLREVFLHQHPNQVYANVDNNAWVVVGPGVYFEIPEGEGGTYEALYGSRHPVNSAQLATIRRLNGV
ncbi:hypothetical protein [Frigoribacterium sp. VKM Ac-2530]|uniref:hypothetical protein n=1 Tax=Frigoribacterium sp. VKM Ac-2530 TaxID=2783822 RepID=UPI001889EAB6|nr:hypothetical protein [Frigoribacterium sp. VKM Ac-2530]MBF4578968.1 hypothetical protein [Frigoribacterium sp. VKM Ac-2530]